MVYMIEQYFTVQSVPSSFLACKLVTQLNTFNFTSEMSSSGISPQGYALPAKQQLNVLKQK